MEEKNPIQVADRLFQTLELLAENGTMGLMNISETMELNKSTTHRILNSLIYMGYAKQDDETGKYELTMKLVRLSNQIMGRVDMIQIVRPYLRQLVDITNETVHFVKMEGVDAVYIDKVESYSNAAQMVSRIGSRTPLYCSGVGKSIMAELKEREVKNIWDVSSITGRTPNTITDFRKFKACLKEIKEKGYALDNEENEIGVRCIAVSLSEIDGNDKYAFSISAPVGRMSDERIRELKDYILETKQKICAAIGI